MSSAPGLLIRGELYDVPGVRVVPPASHGGPPWNTLHADDYRARGGDTDPSLIVAHTTGGHWPQPLAAPRLGGHAEDVIKDFTGANRGGGELVHAGAHAVTDYDGTVYCLADMVLACVYHAQAVNPRSVGIEMCTLPDGSITQATLAATALLIAALTRSGRPGSGLLAIPLMIPRGPYRGHPLRRLAAGPAPDLVGVIGHRDQTEARGAGDPGDRIWTELAALGAEGVDYDGGEDLALSRARQRWLNAADARRGDTWSPLVVDGVCGPRSLAAARRNHIERWRDVPTA